MLAGVKMNAEMTVSGTGQVLINEGGRIEYPNDESEADGYLGGHINIGPDEDVLSITGSVSISGTLGATESPWITQHAYNYPQALLRYVPWPNVTQATNITDVSAAGLAVGNGELHKLVLSATTAGGDVTIGFHTNNNTTAQETVTVNHGVAGDEIEFVFSASQFMEGDKLHLSIDPDSTLTDTWIAGLWHVDTANGGRFFN